MPPFQIRCNCDMVMLKCRKVVQPAVILVGNIFNGELSAVSQAKISKFNEVKTTKHPHVWLSKVDLNVYQLPEMHWQQYHTIILEKKWQQHIVDILEKLYQKDHYHQKITCFNRFQNEKVNF